MITTPNATRRQWAFLKLSRLPGMRLFGLRLLARSLTPHQRVRLQLAAQAIGGSNA